MADLGSIATSITSSYHSTNYPSLRFILVGNTSITSSYRSVNNNYLTFSMVGTTYITSSYKSSPNTQSAWVFSMTDSDSGNITKLFYENDLKFRLGPITCDDEYLVLGGKDIISGSPSTPSLRMDSDGRWRFRWQVDSGNRTIQVKVKQSINQDPRPSLVIRSRPEIGINEDISSSAAPSTDWIDIGPISISPISSSVVWVELHNNFQSQPYLYPCYWDHVVVT